MVKVCGESFLAKLVLAFCGSIHACSCNAFEDEKCYAQKSQERDSGEMFRRHRRSMWQNLAKCFTDCRPSLTISLGFHGESSSNSTSEETKFFYSKTLDVGGSKKWPNLLLAEEVPCNFILRLQCHGALWIPQLLSGPISQETRSLWHRARDCFGSLTPEARKHLSHPRLGCRKWGFKRWGFKQIRGYLRKKALFLRFLDFPHAVRALRKRAKKAEKGQKRPISADFQDGRPDTP